MVLDAGSIERGILTAESVPIRPQSATINVFCILGYSRFVLYALSLSFVLLLSGCENDLEKLNSSHSCVRCYLKGVDLTGADLQGANLNWSFLEQARLDNANLTDVNLNGARLAGASLQRTVMIGADIRKATLVKAVMNNVDLRQADLSESLSPLFTASIHFSRAFRIHATTSSR